MKLIFRLRFQTKIGQSLFITGNHDLLGGGLNERAIPLQYLKADFWQVTLNLPDDAIPDIAITYNYLLRNTDGSVVQDWGDDRVMNPASFKQNEILIIDSWNNAGAVVRQFPSAVQLPMTQSVWPFASDSALTLKVWVASGAAGM